MNTIQKMLLTAFAFLLCVNFATAQGRPGPGGPGFANMTAEEMATKQTERMTKHLSLSEEQVTLVQTANLEFAKKAKELRENAESREAAREQMTTLREEHANALKEVLSEEQFQKFEEAGPGQRRTGKNKKKGKGKQG